MSSSFKHPKAGVDYFRRAVPNDLREAIGKREVKVPLKTKSPAEAHFAYALIGDRDRGALEGAALRRSLAPLQPK